MGAVIKLVLRFKRAFWRDEKLAASTRNSGPRHDVVPSGARATAFPCVVDVVPDQLADNGGVGRRSAGHRALPLASQGDRAPRGFVPRDDSLDEARGDPPRARRHLPPRLDQRSIFARACTRTRVSAARARARRSAVPCATQSGSPVKQPIASAAPEPFTARSIPAGARLPESFAAGDEPSSDRATALDHAQQHRDDRDDEQQMDQPAADVKREETQRPENYRVRRPMCRALIQPEFESVVQRATVVPNGLRPSGRDRVDAARGGGHTLSPCLPFSSFKRVFSAT